jgi:hypothetical protein
MPQEAVVQVVRDQVAGADAAVDLMRLRIMMYLAKTPRKNEARLRFRERFPFKCIDPCTPRPPPVRYPSTWAE